VVNLITAKPTDTFAGNIRAEYGNYNAMKARGMINIPLGDVFALRVAGSYLKRDGFGKNLVTGNDADDRDLFGTRATLSFKPTDKFRAWVMWDHFEEDDNRSRIGKQFCSKDTGPTSVGGVGFSPIAPIAGIEQGLFSQGCRATSLYAPDHLGTVNSQATLGGLFGRWPASRPATPMRARSRRRTSATSSRPSTRSTSPRPTSTSSTPSSTWPRT
jgi:outer membrane receptor protein involved in Fe transport